VRCDVYVRYVFKNDTNGGQDVSSVRWILAVSSCLWLECQFVFLRGPYVTQCPEMTRGYIVRGSLGCVLRLYGVGAATWICGQRLTSEHVSLGGSRQAAEVVARPSESAWARVQPTNLLLFLQKQNLATAIYLFGLGTLLTGLGLKHMRICSHHDLIGALVTSLFPGGPWWSTTSPTCLPLSVFTITSDQHRCRIPPLF